MLAQFPHHLRSFPIIFHDLRYLYHVLASLLLLNMLIAMMAHSYDEVLEEARATYYFRLAQTSATYDRVPLPMLYLLRVPWELGVVCNPWLSEARRSRLLGEVAQVTAPDSRPGLDCPFEYYSLPSSAVHCQPLPLIATYCHLLPSADR